MEEQAARTLAQAVVADLAPQELPLFGPMSRAWFANPDRVRDGPATDDTLGFGVAEAATLLTPVILAVASRVVEVLAEDFGRSLINVTANEIAERIKNLLHHKTPRVVLSKAQLALVRQAVQQTAKERKLPGAEGEKLARCIAAHLTEKG
jgi:hypothetical protein